MIATKFSPVSGFMEVIWQGVYPWAPNLYTQNTLVPEPVRIQGFHPGHVLKTLPWLINNPKIAYT